MNRFLLLAMSLLALACGSGILRAEGPDDEYLRISNLIQQADALAEGGRGELARQKYSEAQTELDRVQKAYPGWNEQVVQFRLNYVMEKLRPAKTAEKPIRRDLVEKTAPDSAEAADWIKLLQEQIRQLTADKELLQAKLKEALSAQPAAVDPRELARSEEKIKSLRKEVEVLTVNLEKAETKPDKPIDPATFDQMMAKTRTLAKELADARRAAQTNADLVSVLQSALRRSQDEKDALAGEKKQAQTPPAYAPAAAPTAQLGEIEPLTHQIAVLRARLDVLEASAVPYSPEELALFKTPDAISANTESNDDEKSSGKSAADARLLVSEAERALAARHYNEAEKKYDEAVDLLSQSAQLNPQDAATFQFLGVTLAEKGLRKPAESAFRRAIQLAPENGEAHHNLAIVYATRQPPALELARWHYQKGLASGHPKDSKLEQMLSANKPAAVSGVNASNR